MSIWTDMNDIVAYGDNIDIALSRFSSEVSRLSWTELSSISDALSEIDISQIMVNSSDIYSLSSAMLVHLSAMEDNIRKIAGYFGGDNDVVRSYGHCQSSVLLHRPSVTSLVNFSSLLSNGLSNLRSDYEVIIANSENVNNSFRVNYPELINFKDVFSVMVDEFENDVVNDFNDKIKNFDSFLDDYLDICDNAHDEVNLGYYSSDTLANIVSTSSYLSEMFNMLYNVVGGIIASIDLSIPNNMVISVRASMDRSFFRDFGFLCSLVRDCYNIAMSLDRSIYNVFVVSSFMHSNAFMLDYVIDFLNVVESKLGNLPPNVRDIVSELMNDVDNSLTFYSNGIGSIADLADQLYQSYSEQLDNITNFGEVYNENQILDSMVEILSDLDHNTSLIEDSSKNVSDEVNSLTRKLEDDVKKEAEHMKDKSKSLQEVMENASVSKDR